MLKQNTFYLTVLGEGRGAIEIQRSYHCIRNYHCENDHLINKNLKTFRASCLIGLYDFGRHSLINVSYVNIHMKALNRWGRVVAIEIVALKKLKGGGNTIFIS